MSDIESWKQRGQRSWPEYVKHLEWKIEVFEAKLENELKKERPPTPCG